MPSTRTVWGIDVGQCALKALKLQWRDNKLRALAFDVIEHGKILSQPDADEQALIRSALSKFMSRNSTKGSTLVISVPGQASFTRFIKLPPVESRKIPEIVRYEARQQIPFNLEDVVWDYQTISAPTAGPREVEVGIFAMKRDIVADYVSDFLAMKIEPDIVQMAPVALYNFLRYEKTEGGGATILIDVGAENTNLVIADGDRVWIRNVPLGGNNFTQALCKEFKLQFSKAENLKRHAAESKHARQVFQAMRPVFGDLLTEIQRSIGYYTSLHRDSRVEHVVGLGNALRLPGLAKFISQNLGVDVNLVETYPSLGESEILSAPLFKENAMSFGVAFGLALQGLGQSTIGTSLLPPEILSAKVMRKKRSFFVVAGVALVGAVCAFAYDQAATSHDLSGRSNEPAAFASEVGKVQKRNNDMQAKFDEQKKKALVAEQIRIDEIEALVGGRDYAYQVLQTIWDAWPSDPNWAKWDPWADPKLRTTFKLIEMLEMTMRYVPDVRVYATSAAGDISGAAAVTVVGAAPPAPPAGEGAAAAPATRPQDLAVPGILVEIEGITPKGQREGQELVNETLLAGLKKCKRTVELQTPNGREVLARMPKTGVFRNHPRFSDYARSSSPTLYKVTGKEAAELTRPDIKKDDDCWFKVEWVLHLGAVPEFQRMDAFRAVCALTQKLGLTDPRLISPARAKDVPADKVKDLDREAEALAQTWLVSREALGMIAAEGVTKEWMQAPAPAPTAE